MKVIALLKQKLDFFTRKNLCNKSQIFYKLKMRDKVLLISDKNALHSFCR